MNSLLSRLQPYPFERLRQLHAGIVPNPALHPISLGIGEPRHSTPECITQAIQENLAGLASYPATLGDVRLRQSIANWLARRYSGLQVDPARQILPVNGSREALFAIAQTVVDASQSNPVVVCPNPFYQIYEGAALLAGADVWFAPSVPAENYAIDWTTVPESVWQRCPLVYVCSPGNPAGNVMDLAQWQQLFVLSDRYGFVIASDECYSEIYFQGKPPLGALEAAVLSGRSDFKRLLSFTSLSKRSNAPGLRSGFVAGDSALISAFLLYRTYHGSAMSPMVQAASIAAWNDEAHVEANRALYAQKFKAVTPLLASVMDVSLPDAGFYLWAALPEGFNPSDTVFSQQLYEACNVVVLPGSYLARDSSKLPDSTQPAPGNPGLGRIRMALVSSLDECLEATRRMVNFVGTKAV